MADPSNAEVAAALDRYGTLLELAGESPFRARAYHRAAEVIRDQPEPVAASYRTGRLTNLPGIGEGISAAVGELVTSGGYGALAELERVVPTSLIDLLAIPGVGIKTVTRLYRELGIVDLASLEAAIVAGRLQGVPGFGRKAESTIVAGLESIRRRTGRIRLGTALPIARDLASAIARRLPAAEVSLAGSVRRMEETVGDIDLVLAIESREEALAALAALPQVATVLARSGSDLRVKLRDGVDADLFVVPPSEFGATLVRATGSAAHLSLLAAPGPESATTEAEFYASHGVPWIPPELRQGRDELMRVAEIDQLVRVEDINGEFHAHTTWSDGAASIAEMAAAAAGRGYRFLGITDHSQALGIARGLDPARLAAQRREIDGLGAAAGVRLVAGAEVEVARDGGLDFDDGILSELDVVIASLHVGLRQPRRELTDRLLAVLANRHVDIIAHPSGRLIERRDGGDFDWERVFAAAAGTGTALEINADPARLDLNDELARAALAAGCLLTINCDAHHPGGFAMIEYGVAVARRAWARPDQVLNCWSLARIEEWLAARGAASG